VGLHVARQLVGALLVRGTVRIRVRARARVRVRVRARARTRVRVRSCSLARSSVRRADASRARGVESEGGCTCGAASTSAPSTVSSYS